MKIKSYITETAPKIVLELVHNLISVLNVGQKNRRGGQIGKHLKEMQRRMQ